MWVKDSAANIVFDDRAVEGERDQVFGATASTLISAGGGWGLACDTARASGRAVEPA